MARKTFKLVDGSIAHNFKELALLLGVDKVTREDISEGGQYADMIETSELEDTASESTNNTEETTGDNSDDNKVNDVIEHTEESDTTPQDNNSDPKPEVDKTKIYTTVNTEDLQGVTKEEILESMPKFVDLNDLKNFIKDIDTPTLEFMARGLELEWSPTYHASIHRMRMALAMQHYFFPELFTPKSDSKNKSKYGDYSTVDLEKMAKDNKVNWSRTSNDRINRMKLITALKASGFLPQ